MMLKMIAEGLIALKGQQEPEVKVIHVEEERKIAEQPEVFTTQRRWAKKSTKF